MKLIIVISRIHFNEFDLYARNKNNDNIDLIETGDKILLMLNGYNCLDNNDDNNATTDNIYQKVNNLLFGNYSDTVVAWHFNDDLSDMISVKFNQPKWGIVKVQRYGTELTPKLYSDILIKLGGILKDNNIQLEERNKLIEKLYNFFLGNPKLEAKLNLLHQCLTHEGVKVVKKELDKQSGKYKEIKDEVNKVKHHGKTVVEYLFEHSICFDGDDYIEPLSKLRDELLQD